jgi:hypothetical protein
VRFEKCRYFFITTGPKNDPRIDSMNIGISPFKKPRAQINADEAEVRRQLSADGWTPGRLVSRTEKDPSLIAGVPTSGEERYWSKAQTLLTLSSRRMDDAKPGEDARTAGEFILFIDLAPHARLERGPTAPDAGASAASGGSP